MNWPLKTALVAFVVCSGCTVGRKYQQPTVPATPTFKELAGNDEWKVATPSDELIKGKWWEMFGDPELNRLEEMVEINNQNVKQAEAQFRVARALVNLNRANYYPTIGANGSITQTDSGGAGGRGGGTSQSFSIGGNASWEPDLWGRVRLSVENAVANAQVSAADLENARLSAQALLAADYFLLIANDMQQAILRETIEAYTRNLQLTTNRYNGGVASKSDITLAQTSLADAQASFTDLHIARSQQEHAIAVLTGQAPAGFSIPVGSIKGPPPSIPLSLPSALLERRPDIAANERLVAASNASVGLAQTAYYPTLTLSANAGLANSSLVNLFTYASRVWSAGPSITQTIYDFGRRKAQVQGALAQYDSTVAVYRQSVLAAFQEVEDDLASLRYLAEEAVQQRVAVEAAQQSLVLEMARYRAGTDSYLNVITTQTIELNDRQQSVTILQRRMLAAVDLVKALGGGWDSSTLPTLEQLRSAELADPNNTQKVAQPANK